jgi:hypothetical protein
MSVSILQQGASTRTVMTLEEQKRMASTCTYEGSVGCKVLASFLHFDVPFAGSHGSALINTMILGANDVSRSIDPNRALSRIYQGAVRYGAVVLPCCQA